MANRGAHAMLNSLITARSDSEELSYDIVSVPETNLRDVKSRPSGRLGNGALQVRPLLLLVPTVMTHYESCHSGPISDVQNSHFNVGDGQVSRRFSAECLSASTYRHRRYLGSRAMQLLPPWMIILLKSTPESAPKKTIMSLSPSRTPQPCRYVP